MNKNLKKKELSYECFIINLFTNCRGRTWSQAGPSTCFNVGCALSHKTMEINVSSRSKNTIPVFFSYEARELKTKLQEAKALESERQQ